MSTKIYNAYRSRLKIRGVFKQLCKIREQFKDYKIAAVGSDSSAREFLAVKENGFWKWWDKIKTESIGDRNEEMNLRASAVVYFYGAEIYIGFFGLPRVMNDAIERAKWLEDFHYQNSCDGPEDISPEEWRHRRNTWDAIMPTGVPSESGFTFPFNTPTVEYDVVKKVYEYLRPQDAQK